MAAGGRHVARPAAGGGVGPTTARQIGPQQGPFPFGCPAVAAIVSRPLARHTTRGAFYRGLRLMIIDGQKLLLPDTPANRKAFGKHTTRRSGRVVPAGYPQVHLMRLLEAGTQEPPFPLLPLW